MEQFTSSWEKVQDADDPRRCQGVIPSQGQCLNVAVEHSTFCPGHGGNRAFQAKKAEELKNYRLNKFKARVQRLGNSDGIMSLRDEVAILRMLIEEKINQCKDETDLLLISGPLSDLIMKSDKLVTSCNRLESKLGNHLDRTKILQFAQVIVQVISNHVDDETILETISNEILTALQSQGGN